ncbi:MAG TPA: hypothetical protein VN374_06100, partial [Desulfitobacteriaceae bacterium]|nr:hypothetical protein [Desulfitobacteriaceae bacterium]
MGLETRNLNTTAIKQGYNSAYKVISNWVPTNDGRYMCCWMDSSTKELQTGFSADLDFLSVDFAMESVVVTSGITVDGYSRNQTSLFKRTDGKVLL